MARNFEICGLGLNISPKARSSSTLVLFAGVGSAAFLAYTAYWWRRRLLRGEFPGEWRRFEDSGGGTMDDTISQLLGLCFPCCMSRRSPAIFTALDAAVNQGSLDPVRAELASRPGCVNHPRREDGALPLHVAVRTPLLSAPPKPPS